MFINAPIGALNNMNTIMMLNICRELPVMYIPIAFIGSCLAGASANSHAFLSLRVSISSCEGGLRGVMAFLPPLDRLTCVEDVKPGGSANAPAFGFDGGVELRSSTH